MAGQGTVGLEILEDVPDADAIVVPVGGGGLLAGVSLAVKTLRKNCKIIVSVVRNVRTRVDLTFTRPPPSEAATEVDIATRVSAYRFYRSHRF